MKKIWILVALFVFAGCQPEAQKSPAVSPATVAKVDVQEETTPTPVAPVPQKAPAKIMAALANAASVQTKPGLEAGKPDVASPPQVAAVQVAEPAKVATTAGVGPAPVASPAPPAQLSEAEAMALAKKKNCLACHALDKKTVGPAWRAVAEKYRGDAGAQALLEVKVRKGGKGVWGSVAMPPQPALSGEELTGLVQFVLQLE
jgi:cytochrome c